MSDRFETAKRSLTEYLKGRKCRNTPERYAILEAVYRHNGHFTAQELYESLQDRLPVSRATVYSSLKLFLQIGLVMKNVLDRNVVYEKCYGKLIRCRMVCTECGKTKEFTDEGLNMAIDGVKFKKFRMESSTVNVFGVCYRCQAKITRERRKLEKERQKKLNNKAK